MLTLWKTAETDDETTDVAGSGDHFRKLWLVRRGWQRADERVPNNANAMPNNANAMPNNANAMPNNANAMPNNANAMPNNVNAMPNNANAMPNNQTVPANNPPNNETNNQNPACPAPTAFDVGATYTNEVRVAPGESLEAALQAATPGTRIILGAGQHNGGVGVSGVTGTADAPIAIVGEDGAELVGGATAIQLSDPAYVVFENFTVRDSSANGFNIDDGGDYSTPAHHVVFRDVTVRNIGDGGNQDCVKLSGLDDFHIEGADLSGCSGQSIDMVGCHDGVITANYIHDTPGAGVQAKGGTADILVHRNLFADVEGRTVNLGGSTGLEFFRPIDAPHEGARITVVGNVVVRPAEAAFAYVGCDACVASNNTIVHPQRWVARILQETVDPARFVPSRDGEFTNNIVVFQNSVLRTFVNVGPDTAPDTFMFDYNLWWDLDDPGFSGPTYSDGIPAAQNDVAGDPGFDPNGTDFAIAAGSPAEGVGTGTQSLPDFAGNCFANPPSMGAHEVQ